MATSCGLPPSPYNFGYLAGQSVAARAIRRDSADVIPPHTSRDAAGPFAPAPARQQLSCPVPSNLRHGTDSWDSRRVTSNSWDSWRLASDNWDS